MLVCGKDVQRTRPDARRPRPYRIPYLLNFGTIPTGRDERAINDSKRQLNRKE
jgi:hypothetical protein